MTVNAQLEELLNNHGGLRANYSKVIERPDTQPDFGRDAAHYVVTLRFEGRQITFWFSCGSAHTQRPSRYDILDTLISTSVHDEYFEDWCGIFGYDTDSRKACATYDACVKQGKDVKFLLGDKFQNVLEIVQHS